MMRIMQLINVKKFDGISNIKGIMLINASITYWIESYVTNDPRSLVETRCIVCNDAVTSIVACIFAFVYLDLQFGKEHQTNINKKMQKRLQN